jgi:hypothetical protein
LRSFNASKTQEDFAAHCPAKRLWLVDDAPRCRICLEKLGVRYRAAYGFGRTERLKERDRRVDRLQGSLKAAQCASNLCRQTGATGASIDATASQQRCSEPASPLASPK